MSRGYPGKLGLLANRPRPTAACADGMTYRRPTGSASNEVPNDRRQDTSSARRRHRPLLLTLEEFTMAGKNTAVFGIYPTAEHAERAVDSLTGAGFPSTSISVLLPDTRSSREFAHEKETKAPEGTAVGATTGGVIGGTLGVPVGIGSLAIPGWGPFTAAGPIMAGLAGLGVGGTVGGLVGALVGMGIPEYEAKRYEGRVKDGGT